MNTNNQSTPQNWEKKQIKDIANVVMGQSPPSELINEVGVGTPFLQGNAEFGPRNPIPQKWITKPLKTSREGGVLISVRAPVGEINLSDQKYCIGRGLSSIEYKIEPEYGWYLTFLIKRQLDQVSQGSTFLAVSKSDVESCEITLPNSKNEREKIAETLSITDDAIIKTKQLISKYKSIKQGLMQDLFQYGIDEKGQIRSEKTHKFKDSPLGRIPEEWEVTNFESVCVSGGMVRGPFGGALKKEIFVKEGYKVYEQGNAIYQNYSLGEYFVTEKKYKEMKRFSVASDDFIISCSGTIGCIYRIPKDAPEGIINQALLKITLNNKLDKDFFDYYFDAQFRSRIVDSTQGGVINNLVGMDQIRNAQLKLLPLPEQKRISSTLTAISDLIRNESEYENKLASLKQGLMQDLLTGKVRVTHLLN